VQTYKVAVWATGGVGRLAIRTVVDRPNLELVGAWVHSARKDGEDVGTLADKGGLKSAGVLTWGWGAAVTMVADALGVQLDEIREECEFLPTPRRLETARGVIEVGTVGATYAKCIGVVDGQEVITIEHVDRMADDLAPDWPKSRTGAIDGIWRVIIDGEPSFDAEFEVGFRPDEDSSDQGLLATGMRAVNAIPWVCDAEPGIVDALHLPLTSPLGALHPNRDGVPAF
jgi:hypothetical protein